MKRLKHIKLLNRNVFFAFCLIFFSHFILICQTIYPSYEDGAVYIKFKENADLSFFKTKAQDISINQISILDKNAKAFAIRPLFRLVRQFNNPILAKTIEVYIEEIAKIDAFVDQIAQDPQVEYVEKKPLYRILDVATYPNDSLYRTSEHGGNLRWHLDLINAEQAWTIQKAVSHIKIAVVDNAVWGEHPDLQIPSELQYNVSTKKNDSKPPDKIPQNQICETTLPVDCPPYRWSHGTHCAGAAGAINNNKEGIASIGGGLTLMGVSCPGSSADGIFGTDLGITWAIENGAKVLSLSWGSDVYSRTDEAFFESVAEKGVIIVVAAGNRGSLKESYPAAYSSTISVGACNSDKTLGTFSNYGKWVDIAGPGGWKISDSGIQTKYSIFSTMYCYNQAYRLNGIKGLDSTYYDGNAGTSMACPIVAGLCGLLLSKDSTIDVNRMREILRISSQKIPEKSRQIAIGAGVIDAFAALKFLSELCEEVQCFKVEKQHENIKLSWEPPKSSEQTLLGYRVYRDGILIANMNKTEMFYIDSNLSQGNYRYGVSAVYGDNAESLRRTADITMGRFYYLKLSANPEEAGIVEGAGDFEENTEVRILAKANKGYEFINWKQFDYLLSEDAAYSFPLSKNASLVAYFKPIVSIAQSSSNIFNLYPNPAKNVLHIETSSKIDQIEILNLYGKILLKERKNSQFNIDISSLPNGIYFIRIHSQQKIYTMKFTKIS